MKKVYKKKIIITGGSGLLGSYFAKKYKKKFQIVKYPNRIEDFTRFQKWIMNKKFDYFIHFAAITRNSGVSKKKNVFSKHIFSQEYFKFFEQI